jgi:hypothetical protein
MPSFTTQLIMALQRVLKLTLVSILAAGCGDGPVEPNLTRDEVAGAYVVTSIAFDPQGSLPEIDIAARLSDLGKPQASLSLAADGTAQLLFEDPGSSLLRLVQGTYRTTPTGITIDLGSVGAYADLLLPRVATYERAADGSFDLELSTSVSREALFDLAPEWAEEPLLDPVPGQLRVNFEPGD